MHESKHTISTNNLKRKDISNITPFESYNSLTKQRIPHGHTYLTSSRKKTNRSLFGCQDKSSNNHVCLQHSLPINSVCFTCNFILICQQCQKKFHIGVQHDVRSLQKSTLFIKNQLIQSQIKLQAKCNILTNLNQQLNDQKVNIFTQKNEYRLELQKTFEYFHLLLKNKQKQMTEQIQEIFQQNDKRFADTIYKIKSLQSQYDQCQQKMAYNLQLNTQTNSDFNLCHFYSQNCDTLKDIVKQSQFVQFRKQIYQLKLKIQNGSINSIIKSLNDIQVGYDVKLTYFDLQQEIQSRPSSLKKIISKVKSQNQLKLKPSKKKLKKHIRYLDLQKTQKASFPQSRIQKQRESHKINGTFCTSTPKQGLSKQKRFDFLKKSPEPSLFLLKKRKKSFGKMISMPASPAKEDKQEGFSPLNKAKDLIIEGMKKKTTITKKKK